MENTHEQSKLASTDAKNAALEAVGKAHHKMMEAAAIYEAARIEYLNARETYLNIPIPIK